MGLPLELTGTLLTAPGGARLLLVAGAAGYALSRSDALADLPDGARVRVSAVLLPPTDAEGAPTRLAVRRAVVVPEPADGP